MDVAKEATVWSKGAPDGHAVGCWCGVDVITYILYVVTLFLNTLTSHRMNTIFKNFSEKNLKMYIINAYAKTPEIL
jgi:hypothetical protein